MAQDEKKQEHRLPGLKSDQRSPFKPPEGEDPQQEFEIGGNETFAPTQGEERYIDVVLQMSEMQFARFDSKEQVMPEEPNLSERFPGIDPVGKYSVVDMRFAQREAILRGMLESCPSEVRDYVNGLLDKRGDPTTPFAGVEKKMIGTARRQRLASRASRLCADVAGRKLMYLKARDLDVDRNVEQYDKLMQGLEYAAGVREGPVPREVTDFYRDTLQTELDLGMVAAARTRGQVPTQIHMNFQNLENKVLQSTFANPDNWGKSPEEIARIAGADDMSYEAALPSYIAATADRVIDPMFREAENNVPANLRSLGVEFSRGDLISIDGKTVRETMQEMFQKSGRTGSFDDFYKQNVRQAANELVAAGLMAGKRVETFVPTKYGEIPKEPSQITKTGYEPSPLKPEKFNAWQRFFAKRGFYKAKVARQAEYERVMAARERMKASAQAGTQKRTEMLKDAVRRSDSMSPLIHKDLFFGEIMGEMDMLSVITTPEGKTEVEYDWSRMRKQVSKINPEAEGGFLSFERSEPADACIMGLMAQGHRFEDIMNPEKLQDERQAMARQLIEHGETNDQDWLGRIYYHGFKATLQQLQEMTQGVDLSDEIQMARVIPTVEALAHSAFSANQTLKADGCRLAYFKAAMEDAGGDLDKGNQMAESIDRKINCVSLFSEFLLDGIRGQAKLSDPQIEISKAALNQTEGIIGSCLLNSFAMKFVQPGAPILDWTPDFNTTGYAFAVVSPQTVPVINALEKGGPELKALWEQNAASGKLMGEQLHTSVTMSKATIEETVFRLVRDEGGAIVGRNFRVQKSYSQPEISVEVDKELTEPVKQEPQVQAQAEQKRAPHRQTPRRQSPQVGGPRL